MSERTHPDIFTKDEAWVYLRLVSERAFDAVEKEFHLPHYKFGQQRVYHRPDLDACALRMMGKVNQQAMKIA